MGKDRQVGPGLSIMLLASLTIGAVYWTSTVVSNNDAYYDTFVRAMDFAIDQAYGQVISDKRLND